MPRRSACLFALAKGQIAVAKLANELVRAPGGELAAGDVLERIVVAMSEPPATGADQPAHPRTIWVR
jgi:hypothetical protein